MRRSLIGWRLCNAADSLTVYIYSASSRDFPISLVMTRSNAYSGRLEMLNPPTKGWGIYELTHRQTEKLLAERCEF